MPYTVIYFKEIRYSQEEWTSSWRVNNIHCWSLALATLATSKISELFSPSIHKSRFLFLILKCFTVLVHPFTQLQKFIDHWLTEFEASFYSFFIFLWCALKLIIPCLLTNITFEIFNWLFFFSRLNLIRHRFSRFSSKFENWSFIFEIFSLSLVVTVWNRMFKCCVTIRSHLTNKFWKELLLRAFV